MTTAQIKFLTLRSLPFIAMILINLTSLVAFVPQSTRAANAPTTAYGGLVQCDGVVDAAGTAKGQKVCNFAALINQIKFIINWMFYISVPIAVGFFAYAGILHMTGIPGNISQARAIFSTVGKGFLAMASAWFIVYTILTWLTKSTEGYTSLLQ